MVVCKKNIQMCMPGFSYTVFLRKHISDSQTLFTRKKIYMCKYSDPKCTLASPPSNKEKQTIQNVRMKPQIQTVKKRRESKHTLTTTKKSSNEK